MAKASLGSCKTEKRMARLQAQRPRFTSPSSGFPELSVHQLSPRWLHVLFAGHTGGRDEPRLEISTQACSAEVEASTKMYSKTFEHNWIQLRPRSDAFADFDQVTAIYEAQQDALSRLQASTFRSQAVPCEVPLVSFVDKERTLKREWDGVRLDPFGGFLCSAGDAKPSRSHQEYILGGHFSFTERPLVRWRRRAKSLTPFFVKENNEVAKSCFGFCTARLQCSLPSLVRCEAWIWRAQRRIPCRRC